MGDSHTAMQYRKLPHGQERISVIGLGMGSIHEGSEEEIEQTVRLAMERGVNYFDMVASEEKPYACYARAFAGHRQAVYLQMHFGAVYHGGRYGWTRDLSEIRHTSVSYTHLDVYKRQAVHIGFLFIGEIFEIMAGLLKVKGENFHLRRPSAVKRRFIGKDMVFHIGHRRAAKNQH